LPSNEGCLRLVLLGPALTPGTARHHRTAQALPISRRLLEQSGLSSVSAVNSVVDFGYRQGKAHRGYRPQRCADAEGEQASSRLLPRLLDQRPQERRLSLPPSATGSSGSGICCGGTPIASSMSRSKTTSILSSASRAKTRMTKGKNPKMLRQESCSAKVAMR
jgi:hypothetical protein